MPAAYFIDQTNSISASNTHGLFDPNYAIVWVKQSGSIYSENFNLAGCGLAITHDKSQVIIDGMVAFMAGTSFTGWASYWSTAVFLGAGVSASIGVTGRVIASGYFGDIPALMVMGGNSVANAGLISGQNGIYGFGANAITNSGTIEGDWAPAAGVAWGIYISGDYDGRHSNIQNSGAISGQIGIAGRSLDIVNSGSVLGADKGIDLLVALNTAIVYESTIINRGEISGGTVGVYASQAYGPGMAMVLTLSNYGSIVSNAHRAVDQAGNTRVDFLNAGLVEGSVTTGGQADLVTNTAKGIIHGDIFLAGGDDVLDNDGQITGQIDLGYGDDTLFGSDRREVVLGGNGSDQIDMNGGNDVYKANSGGDDGDDSIDGGLGRDTYNAGLSQAGVLIDLAQGVAVGAQIGTDLISDIEWARGSNFADTLRGDGGDNFLFGQRGADVMEGGDGADRLNGGQGADTMTGGAGADVFIYLALNESGTSVAGRDRITDFVSGADHIDLRRADGNSLVEGSQNFIWRGDQAFTGVAGEVRFRVSGPSTLVFIDQDGDSTADFSLELTGITSLTAQDFLL